MVSLLAGVLVARCLVAPDVRINDSTTTILSAYEILVSKQVNGRTHLLMLNNQEGTSTSFHDVEGILTWQPQPNGAFADLKATDPNTGTTIFLHSPGQKRAGSVYASFYLGTDAPENRHPAQCYEIRPASNQEEGE